MKEKNLEITGDIDPLKIFKPPFRQSFGIKIFTSEGRMAMDLCARIDGDDEEFLQRICNILNGDSNEKPKMNVSYDPPYIYFDDKKIFLIRGWGYLTGCGALNLPSEVAVEIQDNFANWVANKLNGVI